METTSTQSPARWPRANGADGTLLSSAGSGIAADKEAAWAARDPSAAEKYYSRSHGMEIPAASGRAKSHAIRQIEDFRASWSVAAELELDSSFDISCDVAQAFLRALPLSYIDFEAYPEPDGSMGLEYHHRLFSMYVSCLPSGTMSYVAVFRSRSGEEIHRGDGIIMKQVAPTQIVKLLYDGTKDLATVFDLLLSQNIEETKSLADFGLGKNIARTF